MFETGSHCVALGQVNTDKHRITLLKHGILQGSPVAASWKENQGQLVEIVDYTDVTRKVFSLNIAASNFALLKERLTEMMQSFHAESNLINVSL